MIDKIIGDRCTGCTSCENACPVKAIQMKENSEGFLYPIVDQKSCIKCGLCEKKCPILSQNENCYVEPIVYAAWNLNEAIRIESTSGGVFSALAKVFIQQGGSVVGAIYDEDFLIKHVMINNVKDIEKLRQSKYAQSDLEEIFLEIEQKLKMKEKILFCGTPCQSVGLQKYLGKKYDTLYCCDFICRGVISPLVYRKFLNDMENKHSTKIQKVHFKNKDYGWNQFSTKLTFEDQTSYQKDRDEDFYMRGFLKHNLYLRPSCHQCEFKTIPRCSDISLGDFWGIGNYKAELDNNKGTSVVLINSEKGKRLLSWSEKELYIEQRKIDEVMNGNTCLMNSASRGEFRDYFFENINRISFQELIKRIDKKSLHLSPKERILLILHNVKMSLLRKSK